MSDNFYNLIMATVPEFYSGNEGEFTIPKDRFLQYTEDHIKEEFQSLDEDAIARLKSLPAIFATEDEVADARIGKITDITVSSHALRAKYKFDEDRYQLTGGVLKENWQKLGIKESGYEFHRGHWGVKECDLADFYEEYLKSLTGIAHKLKSADKKVQLIYAFNGTGKTRLSRALKDLIAPKTEEGAAIQERPLKVLYYDAFTEDLFYWDNDLENDNERKLKIQPNSFTDWILRDQGQDQNIITNFQRYTSRNLTPSFIPEDKEVVQNGKRVITQTYPKVTFSFGSGSESIDNIKISKGEESNFIWSIFFTMLEEVVGILQEPDISKRDDNQFDQLEYVFIDDPVSSLDDNHLIELAVNIAGLVKSSESDLKFIITTHNPLFYNVLHNELGTKLYKNPDTEYQTLIYKPNKSAKYRLSKKADGSFDLDEQSNDAPFSYHLLLLSELKKAIDSDQVKKYHFNYLRNILEKTATFLGYKRWGDLLPKTDDGKANPYEARIINFSSHSAHSGEEVAELVENDKEELGKLVNYLISHYGFSKQEEENG